MEAHEFVECWLLACANKGAERKRVEGQPFLISWTVSVGRLRLEIVATRPSSNKSNPHCPIPVTDWYNTARINGVAINSCDVRFLSPNEMRDCLDAFDGPLFGTEITKAKVMQYLRSSCGF